MSQWKQGFIDPNINQYYYYNNNVIVFNAPSIDKSTSTNVLIDSDNIGLLKNYKWYVEKNDVIYTIVNGSYYLLHRIVSKAAKGTFVKHKNKKNNDNRKSNLLITDKKPINRRILAIKKKTKSSK